MLRQRTIRVHGSRFTPASGSEEKVCARADNLGESIPELSSNRFICAVILKVCAEINLF